MNSRSSNSRSSNSSSRIHGFDAIRAGAIVLVVLLHAAVPYLDNRMPGLLWPVFEGSRSVLIDGLFWWIECFIMALYFVTAGFFAAHLMQSKGANEFLSNRGKRLFAPLTVASLTIIPISGYIWVLGWVLDGKCGAVKLRSFKFDDPAIADNLWGFAHLWFLQYLCFYCLAMWAVGVWRQRRNEETAAATPAGPQPRSWLWAAVFGVPICIAALWFDPQIVIGFQQSIAPVLPRTIYYAVFFVIGACLFSQRGWMPVVQRWWIPLLVLSSVTFAVVHPFIQSHIQSGLVDARWELAIGVTLFAWFTSFGLLGLSLKRFTRPIAAVRYCADASYWMYLVHLPIAGAAHIVLKRTPLNAGLKFAIASLATLGLTLLTYQLFVRQTRLGNWLEGARPRMKTAELALESEIAVGGTRDRAAGDAAGA